MNSTLYISENSIVFKWMAIISSVSSFIIFLAVIFVLDPFEEICSLFSVISLLFIAIKFLCTADWYIILFLKYYVKPYKFGHKIIQVFGIVFVGLILLVFLVNIYYILQKWNYVVAITLLPFIIDFVLFIYCDILALKKINEGEKIYKNKKYQRVHQKKDYFECISLIKFPVEQFSLKATIEMPFIPYYIPNE